MAGATSEEGADPAFAALFAEEQPAIVRTVAIILRDPDAARDIAQEAFVRAFVRWRRVRRLDRPGAWVRRVAIHLALDRAEREGRRPDLEGRAVSGDAGSVDGSVSTDVRLDLLDALTLVPARQRTAIVLHHLDDLPVAEVAEALGCSPATARVHLHRGRVRLAEVLAKEADDATR